MASKLLRMLLLLLAMSGSSAAVAQPTTDTNALVPYRINAGDEIEVHVWGEERLQRRIRILPDGSFSFPLVGRVMAVGKLPSEIEGTVSTALAAQYRESAPQVTVSVINPTGMQFSVVGKVRSAGTFTPGRYINALEALTLAGGPTEFADLSNVVIIRKNAAGLTSLRVRLSNALRGSPSSSDLAAGGIPQIQAGDTVVVP